MEDSQLSDALTRLIKALLLEEKFRYISHFWEITRDSYFQKYFWKWIVSQSKLGWLCNWKVCRECKVSGKALWMFCTRFSSRGLVQCGAQCTNAPGGLHWNALQQPALGHWVIDQRLILANASNSLFLSSFYFRQSLFYHSNWRMIGMIGLNDLNSHEKSCILWNFTWLEIVMKFHEDQKLIEVSVFVLDFHFLVDVCFEFFFFFQ